jgi:hypothetical protein
MACRLSLPIREYSIWESAGDYQIVEKHIQNLFYAVCGYQIKAMFDPDRSE